MLKILPGNGARNSFWCLLELRRYFPKEEGMMQYSDAVGISLSDETKVIEPVGELLTPRKQNLHTNNKYSQPDVLKGLSIPFGYGA